MEMDMTTGKPAAALLRFSAPLLAGGILQKLYHVFDAAIVGHILGKNALAAVGNSFVPTLIIDSIIQGISSGILILQAQLSGSGEHGRTQGCRGSVRALVLLVGGTLACIFGLGAKGIFAAMDIPAQVMSQAAAYLRIYALGIPLSAVYHFDSALIKAEGDSGTPIRYLSCSCLLNMALDDLLVARLGLGIRGAAAATVISEGVAAGLIVSYLYRKNKGAPAIPPDLKHVPAILRLGITGIVQNGASAVSMFFIQGAVNRFGVNEISAYTSAYRIETILTLPAASLGASLGVFTARNMGAGKEERSEEGLREGFKISAVIAAAVFVVLRAVSPQLMYMLVGEEREVIRIGAQYLHIISVTFPLCVSLYLLTNFLRGAGEVAYPLFNTLLELSFRTAFAYAAARYIGFYGILLCRPLSFAVSTISLSCRYLVRRRRKRVKNYTAGR